jgi:glycine oxidase
MTLMKRVVIVGGGVIGLFCAVRLAKAGARVTVLEAEAEHADIYGPAASAAAAGMLSPLGETSSAHDALSFESLALWRAWQPGAEWADGVRFDGGVILPADEAEAAAVIARAIANETNATPLSASQFKKRTGLRARQDHAVFVADEGVADPLRVLSGLSMQARAHGVIIEYHADVATVTAIAAKTHHDKVYEADVVLLTPGVWATDKLMAAAPALKRIRPAKGHLVPVRLEGPLAPNVHAPGFYLSTRREDVVLGATMEFDRFDRAVEETQVASLLAAAEAALPGEVSAAGRAWAGIRPMSPDGWPMIGPSGEVLIAAGHSRNGWLLAPITAEIITGYVFGAEIAPAWAALSPDRFEKQA